MPINLKATAAGQRTQDQVLRRMYGQVTLVSIVIFLLTYALLVAGMYRFGYLKDIDAGQIYAVKTYYTQTSSMSPTFKLRVGNEDRVVTHKAGLDYLAPFVRKAEYDFIRHTFLQFLISICIAIIAALLVLYPAFYRQAINYTNPERLYLRGAQEFFEIKLEDELYKTKDAKAARFSLVKRPQLLNAMISGFNPGYRKRLNAAWEYRNKRIFLNSRISIPYEEEPKHHFILGRPGSGKSQMMSKIIAQILARNEKCIIYDFKGDYLSTFYDPSRDLIFNPLDARSISWNITGEMRSQTDIDAIAQSLIPASTGNDAFWNEAARDVLSAILYYCFTNSTDAVNLKTNEAVWNMCIMEKKELYEKLKSTPFGARGSKYLEDPTSGMANSVIAVLIQYTKVLAYMRGRGPDNFTLTDWVRAEAPEKRCIFITNYSKIQDTLKPILSLFVDLAAREFLNLGDHPTRRLFFVVDEFGTLQRLQSIVRLLTTGRSKGASVWLAIQDIGQIKKLYGDDLAQTIVNGCGSHYTFSVSDGDTAKFLSDKIGQVEYLERHKSQSRSGGKGGGITRSESAQSKTEMLYLPADIMGMKDLNFLLRISNYPICRTSIQYHKWPTFEPALIELPDFNLDNLSSFASPEIKSVAPVAATESTAGQEKNKTEISPLEYFGEMVG